MWLHDCTFHFFITTKFPKIMASSPEVKNTSRASFIVFAMGTLFVFNEVFKSTGHEVWLSNSFNNLNKKTRKILIT